MKTEKIINISLISLVSLVLIVILLYGFGVLQTFFQAPSGFHAYGESGTSITGLNLVSDISYPGTQHTVWERNWDSTYWEIKTIDNTQNKPTPSFAFNPQSSDDFKLTNNNVEFSTSTWFGSQVTFTSKHFFGKGKEFRTEFGVANENPLGVNIYLNLIDSSNNVLGSSQKNIQHGNSLLEIKSSPIVDTVQIYWNGQLLNTLNINQDFKLQISYSPPTWSSTSSQGVGIMGVVALQNPAYKDIFNCQVDPDEQYYSFIFKGPITFAKTDLQNFHKWCLDEFPATIYTNAGSTTDQMILMGLESGQSFVVPNGQLYQITYIGEKKSLTTPCELNELLVNGDTCTAKTVLEIDLICQAGGDCAGGEPQTNISDGDSLIIETEAVDYVLSSLQTHQFLANNSKIRFTHYKDDFSSSPSSFDLFGKTFASDGVTSQFGITPQTSSFSYGTSIGGLAIGDIQVLDEINKVALTRVELQDPITVDVGDTQAFVSEWTFEIDTSFLVLTFDEQSKEIIVTNNYYPVDGGMSLMKEDNSGTFTYPDIQKSYPLGETRISIGDTTGLVKVGGRPYFNLETPDSNYKLSGSSAITISDLEEEQIIVTIADEPSTPPIQLENIQGGDFIVDPKRGIKISTGTIVGIVGGLVVGTLVFFIIRGLIRPRIRRRR